MRISDTVHQLDAELKSLAPFDSDLNFSIADADNREQLYLRTFVFMDMYHGAANWFLEPQAAAMFEADSKIKKKRKQVKRDFEKIRGFTRKSKDWSPRRKVYEIDNRFQLRFNRTLKNFTWVFNELESAQQQRTVCFFHSNINDPHHLHSDHGLRRFVDLAEAVYGSDPTKELSHARVCKIMLGIARDREHCLDPIGLKVESFALKHLLASTLASDQTDEEIDDCIAFLKINAARTENIDSTVEQAKWQFLRTASALIDLRDKEYKRAMKNQTHWTNEDAIMSILYRGFSRIQNLPKYLADHFERRLDSEFENTVQFSDDEKKELEAFIKNLRVASKKKQRNGEIRFFPPITDAMTKADFKRELEIQQRRYREIEAACKKPPADRVRELATLNVAWTANLEWKESPILKYVQCNPIHDQELVSQANGRIAVCLAVVKKWRMAHDGNPPTTLDEAFKFADAGPVPTDPFNGEPLKMQNSRVATSVYSVGPDLKDDDMTMLSGKDNPMKGDVVLSVDFD